MEAKYYVDDDGYIVHDESRDTVARILDNEHVEPLTRILESHAALLEALQGDEENCIPNAQTILSQALLGNYEAVKVMLSALCSIHAAAITKATT